MVNPSLPPYVRKADGDVVFVHVTDPAVIQALVGLGFRVSSDASDTYLLPAASPEDKGKLFSELRDRGIYFARGREWNPAEVFEWLKDQGLIRGPFRSIAWKGPKDWFVRDEP